MNTINKRCVEVMNLLKTSIYNNLLLIKFPKLIPKNLLEGMNRTSIFKVSQLIQEDLLPSNKCQFKGFFEDFNDKMNTCGSKKNLKFMIKL